MTLREKNNKLCFSTVLKRFESHQHCQPQLFVGRKRTFNLLQYPSHSLALLSNFMTHKAQRIDCNTNTILTSCSYVYAIIFRKQTSLGPAPFNLPIYFQTL